MDVGVGNEEKMGVWTSKKKSTTSTWKMENNWSIQGEKKKRKKYVTHFDDGNEKKMGLGEILFY